MSKVFCSRSLCNDCSVYVDTGRWRSRIRAIAASPSDVARILVNLDRASCLAWQARVLVGDVSDCHAIVFSARPPPSSSRFRTVTVIRAVLVRPTRFPSHLRRAICWCDLHRSRLFLFDPWRSYRTEINGRPVGGTWSHRKGAHLSPYGDLARGQLLWLYGRQRETSCGNSSTH